MTAKHPIVRVWTCRKCHVFATFDIVKIQEDRRGVKWAWYRCRTCGDVDYGTVIIQDWRTLEAYLAGKEGTP